MQPAYDTTISQDTTDGTAVFRAYAAFTRAAEVATVTSDREFVLTAALDAYADGWFDDGLLVWETGANAGVGYEVKSWTQATRTLTLWQPARLPTLAGDKLRVSPGCRKRLNETGGGQDHGRAALAFLDEQGGVLASEEPAYLELTPGVWTLTEAAAAIPVGTRRPGRSRLPERSYAGRVMTNNLSLSQVAAAQNQKEVTINDQAGQLDAALTDKVDVSLTGTTSPLVLSDAQALRCMVLKLTGTHPGGAYEVHCPTNRKIYVVWNGTAGNVTFKTAAGAGIVVGAGAVLILYCDGTDVIQLAGLVATIDDIGDVVITAAASGQMLRYDGVSWVNEDSPYDVGMFIPGTHGNGALMAQVVLTRAVSFADDFAGARAYAGVTATAETVLDVHRNGAPIGTITFGIGASTGTFATTGGGAETFAAGDRLAIINEDPADATLADLSITFLGKRT